MHSYLILMVNDKRSVSWSQGHERRNCLQCCAEGAVAAALVEAQTFAYVYSAIEKRQLHGDSALIDLQSEKEPAEILGAALLSTIGGGGHLLVLTHDELRDFRIR